MFDHINGPNNDYAGPSVGLSNENGDNWKTVVTKINTNFKRLTEHLTGKAAESVVDDEARKRVDELEAQVKALSDKIDAMTAPTPQPAA